MLVSGSGVVSIRQRTEISLGLNWNILSLCSRQVSGWSNLILSYTKTGDSGNYSCQPSNARQDTVQVNIIKGNFLIWDLPNTKLQVIMNNYFWLGLIRSMTISYQCTVCPTGLIPAWNKLTSLIDRNKRGLQLCLLTLPDFANLFSNVMKTCQSDMSGALHFSLPDGDLSAGGLTGSGLSPTSPCLTSLAVLGLLSALWWWSSVLTFTTPPQRWEGT